MKPLTALFAAFLLISCTVFSPSIPVPKEETTTCRWEVYFSPYEGVTEAIVRELTAAITFSQLTKDGLIISKRGTGSYILERP
jgi:hypothetical protein